jgi:hypothetical protein
MPEISENAQLSVCGGGCAMTKRFHPADNIQELLQATPFDRWWFVDVLADAFEALLGPGRYTDVSSSEVHKAVEAARDLLWQSSAGDGGDAEDNPYVEALDCLVKLQVIEIFDGADPWYYRITDPVSNALNLLVTLCLQMKLEGRVLA